MKNISISMTSPYTKCYPLHHHNDWEVMYYLEGQGYLATEVENLSFHPGSIIIVPPGIRHGSVSEHTFVNISIGGDFRHLFLFDRPVVLQDNIAAEGEELARLIYRNRYADREYLSALCNAYGHFLLQHATPETPTSRCVNAIIQTLTDGFTDPELSAATLLEQSGYAEDYIRAQFKAVTGHTPVGFLTAVRLDHACKLLEIYGQSITVAEVAAACGFTDPVYFSKRFKQHTGLSPDSYRKSLPQ